MKPPTTMGATLALGIALVASAAPGQPASTPIDRFELSASSATYVRWFERALVPGPGGAAVTSESVVPVHEYLSLRASDVDAPWSADSVDVELSLWGSWHALDVEGERRFDGDVTVASVRHRLGPTYLKLGRQIFAGGAARFAWFDGLSVGARSDFGLGVDGYAGLTVLPRWSERPGYRHLGSAGDSLLRSPEALPEPNRADNWLAGARSSYAYEKLGEIGASYHEQRENSELGRRSAGLDLRLAPLEKAELSAYGIADVDSASLADARVAVNVRPAPELTATADYLHADPALFLSRQSVLSVFSTDDFDEVGGEASYRLARPLLVGGDGHAQFFGSERTGVRARGWVKITPDRSERLLVLLSYSRVVEPDNGYHSIRAAIRCRIAAPVVATAEQYSYFYDAAIRGFSASTVEAASLEWQPARPLRLLLGGLVTRSPYAALDAQALLRGIYEFDLRPGGGT